MREMRWNCFDPDKGCYRKLMPRLGVFDECFPGKIGMSDVDGIVEINGRFLLFEFKSDGGALKTGQRIMFERMTCGNADPMKFTVIVVCGNAETMEIHTVQVFSGGKSSEPEPCTIDQLKERMKAWTTRARNARILAVAAEHGRAMPDPPRGPKALDRAMERAAGSAGQTSTGGKARASTDELVAFWRNTLESGRYIAPSAMTSTTRALLLRRGVTTEADLRARGL